MTDSRLLSAIHLLRVKVHVAFGESGMSFIRHLLLCISVS